MRQIVWAVLAGLLFGAGLAVSQMANPAKVLAFLDIGAIPSGGWDPSLAVVLVGALIVTFPGFVLARRLNKPLVAERFEWPTRRDIDVRLVAGSVLFGVGWGLVGYCPGPAIASLAWGRVETVIFVLAMIAGMVIWRRTLGPKTDAPVSAR
ncbi:MAG: YeeE/YedE family protein [Rhodospirillaceae bacterium]|nr:YeeE/YedE family protein [Rhodospirillaceae bacterium]